MAKAKRTPKPRTKKPVDSNQEQGEDQPLEENLKQDLEEIDQEETTDQEGQQAWQKGKAVKCGKNESE